jgi:hypothetical protein
MWRGILEAANDPSFENDFVFTRTLDRDSLSRHPWPIGGERSTSIVESFESLAHMKLGSVAAEVGRTTACGHDPVYIVPWHATRTLHAQDVALPFVDGASVRDWSVTPSSAAIYLYSSIGGEPLDPSDPRVPRYLWEVPNASRKPYHVW